MTLQKNLSNTMNALRVSRRQSIAEFSEELGISRSSMQELLKGNGNPRMDTIEHIAARLQMDPAALLSCSFSQGQMETALLLLQAIDTFPALSDEKRKRAAALLQELILIIGPEE